LFIKDRVPEKKTHEHTKNNPDAPQHKT